jgi:hypothetical protein
MSDTPTSFVRRYATMERPRCAVSTTGWLSGSDEPAPGTAAIAEKRRPILEAGCGSASPR